MDVPFSDVMKKGGYEIRIVPLGICGEPNEGSTGVAYKGGVAKFCYILADLPTSKMNVPGPLYIRREKLRKIMILAKTNKVQAIVICREPNVGKLRYIGVQRIFDIGSTTFDWSVSDTMYYAGCGFLLPLYDEGSGVFNEITVQSSLVFEGRETKCQRSLIS